MGSFPVTNEATVLFTEKRYPFVFDEASEISNWISPAQLQDISPQEFTVTRKRLMDCFWAVYTSFGRMYYWNRKTNTCQWAPFSEIESFVETLSDDDSYEFYNWPEVLYARYVEQMAENSAADIASQSCSLDAPKSSIPKEEMKLCTFKFFSTFQPAITKFTEWSFVEQKMREFCTEKWPQQSWNASLIKELKNLFDEFVCDLPIKKLDQQSATAACKDLASALEKFEKDFLPHFMGLKASSSFPVQFAPQKTVIWKEVENALRKNATFRFHVCNPANSKKFEDIFRRFKMKISSASCNNIK